MENKVNLHPALKANIQDSLHYLMEINVEAERLKKEEITSEEFLHFIERRSKEYGYISDFKHTFRVLEQIKDV